MKKHRTRMMALLLTAIMVLDAAFVAFADMDVQTTEANAQNVEILYEDEEGGKATVTHGCESVASGLLGGVRDEDYPVVSQFSLEEPGKTYQPGDTLKFSFKVTDAQGIDPDDTRIYFKSSDGDSFYVSASKTEYDRSTGIVSCSYTFDDELTAGRYYAYDILVYDIYELYSRYSCSSYKTAQTIFPGYLIFENVMPVTDIKFEQLGQTLKPGDKLNISFKADVQDIHYMHVIFASTNGALSMEYDEEETEGNTLSFDAATKTVQGELVISEEDESGEYYLYSIYVRYGASKTCSLSFDESDGFIFCVKQPETQPWLKELTIGTAGKAFEEEDKLPLTFKIDESVFDPLTVNYIEVRFEDVDGLDQRLYYRNESDRNGLDYDSATGLVSVSETVGELFEEGQYHPHAIEIGLSSNELSEGGSGGGGGSTYAIPNASAYTFTVKSDETEPVIIKRITCLEEGKTLTDGDTVHFEIELETEAEITISEINLRIDLLTTESDSNGSSVKNGNYVQKSFDAKKNESTGIWEASCTFRDTDIYGTYVLKNLFCDYQVGSNTLRVFADSCLLGQTVLFEDSTSKQLNQLKPATDLSWDERGWCKFTMPEKHQGQVLVTLYCKELDKEVRNCTYLLDADLKGEYLTDELSQMEKLISGTYYFAVKMLGDGKTYLDSTEAVSPMLQYTLPEEKTPDVQSAEWTEDGTVRIRTPRERADCGLQVFFYFAGSLTEIPKQCGTSVLYTLDEYEEVELSDSIKKKYGNGYYFFKTQTIPKNPMKMARGKVSELSDSYVLSEKTGEVKKKLEEIDLTGSAADIRKEVSDIGKNDLMTAMLSDDEVQERLEEIEDATKIVREVSVDPEVEGLDTDGIRMIGAALNAVKDGAGKVTLEIRKAQKEHKIPAEYQNTLAIKLSMDLTNVDHTESLDVPVLITIPVPASIPSSFLRILHYKDGSETPDVITPVKFTGADGREYAQFAVTGLSDFILVPEKEKVEVTFDMNGHGTQIDPQMVATGSTVKKPANPTASGYSFRGWFRTAACVAGEAWNFASDLVEDAMTLFAKWTVSEDDGSSPTPAVVKPDEAVTPITTAADGSQMMGSSMISKPISKLSAEERASLIEDGTWTKDAYGRWSLKNAAGTKIKNAWALVSDAICSKPIGNATWYYFDENGYMVTGWVWIPASDGRKYCYYFNKEDGSMYGGCLLGGAKDSWQLSAKGRWIDENGAEQTKQ